MATKPTKDEIGNLPDKEFQITIVKMIRNLEIKMESQINSLEIRTEKMQERFNKDLSSVLSLSRVQLFESSATEQREEIQLHPPEH